MSIFSLLVDIIVRQHTCMRLENLQSLVRMDILTRKNNCSMKGKVNPALLK